MGVPNAGAAPGRPTAGPDPAAPELTELAHAVGAARAGRCMHVDTSGAGDAAAEPCGIAAVSSAEPMNSPAPYGDREREAFAMANSGPRENAPVSVERVRNCRWRRTERTQRGHDGDSAGTMTNHKTTPLRFRGILCQIIISTNAL